MDTSKSDFKQFEGEIYRKAPEGKLKRYWFVLLGKEFYCYRKKDDPNHKTMHSLVGTYVKDEAEEQVPGKSVKLYPFRLIFPPNKSRQYFLISKEDRDRWVNAIKDSIGYSTVEDFYEI